MKTARFSQKDRAYIERLAIERSWNIYEALIYVYLGPAHLANFQLLYSQVKIIPETRTIHDNDDDDFSPLSWDDVLGR